MSAKITVEVLKSFKNKYSKSLHKRGDLLSVSKKRMEEINSTQFGVLVEAVAEEAAKPKKKPKKG